MAPLLLALVVSASPVLEPWGFSLEAKQDRLVVASVRAGSPAERAKVTKGATLLRIVDPMPTREQAYGTLGGDALDAAVATLQAATGDRLVLSLEGKDDELQAVLVRAPFQPKSSAELRAMSPIEQGRYFAEMAQRTRPGPSRFPGVSFRGPLETTAWVDRATHALLATSTGEATGTWLYARHELHYSCVGSRATSVTVRGAGLPAPVVQDLTSEKLEGGVWTMRVPVAKVADALRCPSAPLLQKVELELSCASGAPVLGRDTLRLSVKCAAPGPGVPRLFTRAAPILEPSSLTEGAAQVEVQPPFGQSDAVAPSAVDVLLLDEKGATLQALTGAWKGSPGDWKAVALPAPRAAGDYRVVLDAHWADGSTSRSAPAPLHVATKREADEDHARFSRGVEALEAVRRRLEAQHRNPCDPKTRAWLAKQPEVRAVLPGDDGSYSYLVNDFPSGVLVHCH